MYKWAIFILSFSLSRLNVSVLVLGVRERWYKCTHLNIDIDLTFTDTPNNCVFLLK